MIIKSKTLNRYCILAITKMSIEYKINNKDARTIYDLDITKFIDKFLSPHNIKDSIGFMSKELITLKNGEELKTYRKTVQELVGKPNLKQTIENLVLNDYKLKSLNDEREEIFGTNISKELKELKKNITLYLSKNDIHKLISRDYNILKFYCDLVDKTQKIESESKFLQKIKEEGKSITDDEYYQASKKAVDMMENFGEAKLHVFYDYFDNVKNVENLEFNPKERKISEVFGKYLRKASRLICPDLFLLFFPSRKERFYANSLEFLVEKNLPYIEKVLEYRKKMDFFLGATRYIEKIKSASIPLTYPSFTEKEGFLFKELYNPLLLLQRGIKKKEDIIPNDVNSNTKQNVAIITGPNNTGKTIYVKSIGLAYALAQNGFPVPAQNAQLIELNDMYTQFIHPEDIELGEGSYLDELRRIKELFQNATTKTLLIADEPIRGSSPEDSEEMNLRFIKGFIKLKAPTFLTTHLHNVSKKVDDWEGVRNLQTEVNLDGKEIKPTYKIKPGKAKGSYGVEIADQFGLSEDDINNLINQKTK